MKKTSVLSGGERVRCMLSKMMLTGAKALLMDEPTNHLDLESITALNNGLVAFPEVVLFSSHDHEFVSTVANRIVEITPGGIIDRMMGFDEYLEAAEVAALGAHCVMATATSSFNKPQEAYWMASLNKILATGLDKDPDGARFPFRMHRPAAGHRVA